MSPSEPFPPDERPRRRKRAPATRRLFDAGAALAGVAAGVIFADPVLAAAGGVWHRHVLPAYDTLIANGLLAWCM